MCSERFFEVYNGHPGVNNEGDDTHLSMDALWDVDILLGRRRCRHDLVVSLGRDSGLLGDGRGPGGQMCVEVTATLL